MIHACRYIWSDDQGQNMVEYALILAMILVLVIGSLRLIANNFLR
jgi:Flp pilus assembly pilin Flp